MQIDDICKDINEIIDCYLDRITCLYNANEEFDYAKAKDISVFDIFDKQANLLKQELITVLSAFPEFIIDFYKLDVLKQMFSDIHKYFN